MNRWIVILSVSLYFFTVPHTLEDFSLGVPQEMGAPIIVLSLIVATVLAIQSIGLYWLGLKQKRGLIVQAGIGLFWALASGAAQLPSIFREEVYRDGIVSIIFVVGIVVIGALLFIISLYSLRNAGRNSTTVSQV